MTTIWFVLLLMAARAQPQSSVSVDVRAEAKPVSEADVVIAGQTFHTGADGTVSIPVEAGSIEVTVLKDGFAPATTTVTVAPGQQQRVLVDLERAPTVEEHVTVSATRTDKGVEDLPVRVEVLGKEELEEKVLMTPGDIVMMLNEMGGLRVQATSPSMGAASVRIQGMIGRYTRFFSDGLPLFGQQVGGLGILQIPPTDLGQVEVIKGVASALYGAGAMGGVVNLVSRRPGQTPTRDVLVNRSTRGATDVVSFDTQPLGGNWGGTLLAGGHWQTANDVNGDDWADLSGYNRGEIRPRIFWDDHHGRTLFATAGGTFESRSGGTIDGAALPALGVPYRETLDTNREDAGAALQWPLGRGVVLSARASASWQAHDHDFSGVRERDRHDTTFGEASIRGSSPRQTWVAGAAIEGDNFNPRDVPRFAYSYTVPGIFAQDDVEVAKWLIVSASARADDHSEYGTFVSPRLSALVRSGRWNARLSAGTGFFGPTPLTEETEAAGLTRLSIPTRLVAERGRSLSVDFSRTDGPFSYTATLFASRVIDPILVDVTDAYTLTNSPGPTTNVGTELLATYRHGLFTGTGTYTYVRARELDGGARLDVPLTPRHSAGLIGMWESEAAGRIGLEWYYTGRQRLEANPFRTESRPYMVFGALVEKRFGVMRLFVNGEDLGNVKMTDYEPLLRPSQGVDGRWTVDAWAPLDGRNINGGIRFQF